ncbi:MAG TPA: nitrite reductase small subunit NirD [Stellaceae bacterium]|jgi:nitrite reductase (NADH) small subunit|nr:nitrite reductase small subunit NirD [Stellaceae bacterium]
MPSDRWVEVGRLVDIPRRGARRVKGAGGDVPVAVFRTADDRVFALVDRCPHKAGPLSEGIVQGCAIACPLHGWVIDLETGEAEAPDEGRVPVVPVRVRAGRVFLSAAALGVGERAA